MSEPIVAAEYVDAFDRRRAITPAARAAVLAAMGLGPDEEPPDVPSVALVPRGAPLPSGGDLELEDGTPLGSVDAMPSDAPYGYHRLGRDDGAEQLVITGPGRCHLPASLRAWGWAIQLAATRSRRSWGIGDLQDLGELGRWSAEAGAAFLAVGPLGAPNPGPHPEPSPYYPSTRRFGSPLHLAIEPIARLHPAADVGELAGPARLLNESRTIDRAAVTAAKIAALERIWDAGISDRAGFERWRAERGQALERWAVFSVLTERLGPGWQSWPEAYRSPTGAAVSAVAADASDRVAFHAWVQWCFDRQLAEASRAISRIADMPVGVDPGGFDAWDWQDQLALGASIGAPPDQFNTAGQDWGLPPFVPHRLRQAGYRPFVETIRAQLRHAGGLRIDHVLGLFRQWWVPRDAGAGDGAYVGQPTDELLEIVAIESHRARAVVVGEDLGTVPPGVRDELRRRRLLSTRLVLFERGAPARYPRQAMAAITTHDLPTVAGVLSGSDLVDQRAAGIEVDAESNELLRERLLSAAGLERAASVQRLSLALHSALAASPAALVAATLEDAIGAEERPNLPGTVAPRRDNWNQALPAPLEDLFGDERVAALIDALRR